MSTQSHCCSRNIKVATTTNSEFILCSQGDQNKIDAAIHSSNIWHEADGCDEGGNDSTYRVKCCNRGCEAGVRVTQPLMGSYSTQTDYDMSQKPIVRANASVTKMDSDSGVSVQLKKNTENRQQRYNTVTCESGSRTSSKWSKLSIDEDWEVTAQHQQESTSSYNIIKYMDFDCSILTKRNVDKKTQSETEHSKGETSGSCHSLQNKYPFLIPAKSCILHCVNMNESECKGEYTATDGGVLIQSDIFQNEADGTYSSLLYNSLQNTVGDIRMTVDKKIDKRESSLLLDDCSEDDISLNSNDQEFDSLPEHQMKHTTTSSGAEAVSSSMDSDVLPQNDLDNNNLPQNDLDIDVLPQNDLDSNVLPLNNLDPEDVLSAQTSLYRSAKSALPSFCDSLSPGCNAPEIATLGAHLNKTESDCFSAPCNVLEISSICTVGVEQADTLEEQNQAVTKQSTVVHAAGQCNTEPDPAASADMIPLSSSLLLSPACGSSASEIHCTVNEPSLNHTEHALSYDSVTNTLMSPPFYNQMFISSVGSEDGIEKSEKYMASELSAPDHLLQSEENQRKPPHATDNNIKHGLVCNIGYQLDSSNRQPDSNLRPDSNRRPELDSFSNVHLQQCTAPSHMEVPTTVTGEYTAGEAVTVPALSLAYGVLPGSAADTHTRLGDGRHIKSILNTCANYRLKTDAGNDDINGIIDDLAFVLKGSRKRSAISISSVAAGAVPVKKANLVEVNSSSNLNDSTKQFETSVNKDDTCAWSRRKVKKTVSVQDAALVLCCVCDTSNPATKTSQCQNAHVICQTCLEDQVRLVMASDKMDLHCPTVLCNSSISLDCVSGILPNLVMDLLRDNLRLKADKATAKAVMKMQELVTCPLCRCPSLMDEEAVHFVCPTCRSSCCRYCKAPWIHYGEHEGCILLSFVGDDCLNDITKLPRNWDTSITPFNMNYVQVSIPLTSSEGAAVAAFFAKSSSGRAKVVQIFRIQNKKLWQKYVLKRKHVVEDIGAAQLKEKILFHGTKANNIVSICSEGFDIRVPTANGAILGKGIYFSTSARYSERFADESRMLYLSRVICGWSQQGQKQMTRPQYHSSVRRMYDSCVNDLACPTMYTIFDNSQCYPEYLLQFQY